MPRINRAEAQTESVRSYDEDEQNNQIDENDGFFDTADRVREQRFRTGMHESRETEIDARSTPRMAVAAEAYTPPTNLDAPTPRPGYVQRWVRANFRTEGDNLNWQSKTREGWMPRDPSTVADHESFFGVNKHLGQAVISVGGLILVEIPEQKLLAKRKYIRDKARQQELSVIQETDKVSREVVAAGGAPIIREDRSEVRTGRRPQTLAN